MVKVRQFVETKVGSDVQSCETFSGTVHPLSPSSVQVRVALQLARRRWKRGCDQPFSSKVWVLVAFGEETLAKCGRRCGRTSLSGTCSFSDAPWPEAAEDFPGSADVVKYLEMFAMQYNLLEHVRQQSCVKNLDILPGGWRVTWEQMEDAGVRTSSEVFNFVIVAAGIFSVPRSASVPGAESFSGEWIHAGEYRKPVRFAQRRVLVIGAAFSGADIAADLAGNRGVCDCGHSPAVVVSPQICWRSTH